MRNLRVIDFEDEKIYTRIANSKRSPNKERLIALNNIINKCYNEYIKNAKSLENVKPLFNNSDHETKKNKKSLLHCYENKTKELDSLKKKISESQTDVCQATCQLCDIDSPATLDHYLPKDIYPEYSIFSKNLVPCCYVCNNKRGSNWINNGKRTTLNMYFDDLPENIFLVSKIRINNDIPIVDFEIKDEKLNKKESELIKNHFSTLELHNRYKIQANTILSEIKSEIRRRKLYEFDRTQLKEILKEVACSKRDVFGINNWKASIYDAVIESDACLDILVKQE